MEFRPDLTPPALDPSLVARLTELADGIDGAAPGVWEDDLAEFNRLAGSTVSFEELQGVYGGDGAEAFVRRVLYGRHLTPPPAVSEAEMAEAVARVMVCGPDHDFYLELFLAHCKHPSGTDLIFYPDLVPELPRGREPTAAEVAALALRGQAELGAAADGGGR
jgi:hypothetical protein